MPNSNPRCGDLLRCRVQNADENELFSLTLGCALDYTRLVATTTSASLGQNENGGLREPHSGSPGRATAFVWIATATLAGAVVMAMELAAFRLYAPYFGNSIYVWGSLISVVMVALSAGYALGGWTADRWPTDAVLYLIILGAGIYQLVIVFVMRAVLLKLWLWGEFSGPVSATLIIFGPPMAGLAMCSPFVIRLLARAGHVGITVGKVFALSTVGSIAGVLGTSFYLVPRFGTRVTLEILCAASLVIGAGGLMMRRKAAVVLVALAGLVFFAHGPKPPATLIYSSESAYNRIRVDDYNGLRMLLLNDPHYFQTLEKLGSQSSGFYLDDFALGPLIVPAKSLLVLGMGAGGSIQASWAVAPALQVDAVEIDPAVVRVGQEFFGLPKNDARLRVHIADARPWLATHAVKRDIVHVDLFQGGPYVPFYLTTVEFFRLVKSRLADEGVLIVNVYDASARRELLNAMGATMREVFPTVEVDSTGKGNHIVFAFARKRTHEEVTEKLRAASGPDWVQKLAAKAAKEIVEFEPQANATVFTDDKAPIEEMTRHMLLESQKTK